MPTGAGKSLCYQLPGAGARRPDARRLAARVADAGPGRGAGARSRPGARRSSTPSRTRRDNRAALERAASGELRLLYVAPERFSSPGFLEAMKAARIGLFVVDEAHCVSQWGHDFRPDYFRLADAARWLEAEAIIASTATATPQVASDIARRLGPARPGPRRDRLRPPEPLLRGRARARTAADKHQRLAAALARPGASRRSSTRARARAPTSSPARWPRRWARDVEAYHAGLGREQRAAVQRRFMDGELDVVVATNAFGMGIDKADVRTVATRACRARSRPTTRRPAAPAATARPARALLFAEWRDKGLHVFFIQRAEVDDAGDRARRRDAVGLRRRRPLRRRASARRSAARSPTRCGRSSAISRAPAWSARRRRRWTACAAACSGPSTARARRAAARRRARRSARAGRQYRSVWAFVEGDECRRATILRHFGDPAERPRRRAVLRRLRPDAGCRPRRRGPRGGAARRRAARRPRRGDRRRSCETADPAVGRTRDGRDPARRPLARSCARTPTTACRPTGPSTTSTQDQVLGRVDELIDAGRLRSTGGALPEAARRGSGRVRPLRVGVLASGAGTNLQALLDTVHGQRGARSSPSPPTSPARRRCERAQAAGVPTRVFPRAEYADRDGARRRDRRLAGGARASSSSCSRATWRS